MANWTNTELMAILPTKNVYNLIGTFKNNYDYDDNKKRKFYRTYLDTFSIETIDINVSMVRLTLECAWSVNSCMMKNRKGDYLSLEEVIRDTEIHKLVIYSKEEGVGIEESITFDKEKDDEVCYQCRELFLNPKMLCYEM